MTNSCCICQESDSRSLCHCTEQHIFCKSCLSNYILHTKQGVLPAKCPIPQCTAQMTLSGLMRTGVLQGEALDRVQKVQREREALSGGRGFWCARRTCSELLLAPLDGNALINTVLVCHSCRLLHCWQCQSEWHDGLLCDEYQCLPDEAKRDMKHSGESALKDLASNKDWRRCQQCHVLVERSEGCNHMTCVCRYEFCYQCGSKWVPVPMNNVGKCSKMPPCPLFDDVPDVQRNQLERNQHNQRNPQIQQQQQRQQMNVGIAIGVIEVMPQQRLQQDQVPMKRIRNPAYDFEVERARETYLEERHFMSFSEFNDFIVDALFGHSTLDEYFAHHLRNYICGYCEKSFNNLNGLFSHLRTTKSHSVFSCSCALFDDYSEFEVHFEDAHFPQICPNVPFQILVPDEEEIRRRERVAQQQREQQRQQQLREQQQRQEQQRQQQLREQQPREQQQREQQRQQQLREQQQREQQLREQLQRQEQLREQQQRQHQLRQQQLREQQEREEQQRQQRSFNRNLNLNIHYLYNMFHQGQLMGYSFPFLEQLVNCTCPYCGRDFNTFGGLERHLNTTRQHQVYVNYQGNLFNPDNS